MKQLDNLLKYGLPPHDEGMPEIRESLRREIELEKAGLAREDDLAFLCCAQLFAKAETEDILLIWRAKSSGFDLGLYLDVQMLCGRGLQETRRYLSELGTDEAMSALKYVNGCEAAGDFQDWSPIKQTEIYRNYFGI